MNHAPTTLASYVSQRLLGRLCTQTPITAPEVVRSTTVVLLSDIQGFTALVEAFSRAGRAGLEELTWVLNRYFIELSEVIHAHGGDVLCIAGDAFLCTWPVGEEEPQAQVLQQALQAARAIQARLHEREAGRGHRFRTRIGLSAGPLCQGLVGGVGGRWELIASGPALDGAARAEKACAAGEVAIDAQAWPLVAGTCTGRTMANGDMALLTLPEAGALAPRPAVALPANAAQLLQPFVPPSVLARDAATDAWLAEVRHLTVLLADLPPLKDDEPAAVARTQAGVATFQQVVERFGGTVRVDVDDKGIMVLAVFGLPPRAHEDDPRRAVAAARELRQRLETMGVLAGIGIASGRAFCGAFGSDLRREYLVRGDVINLAARLMQQAQGGVVCDHATLQALRGSHEAEELAPVHVKGRAEPVRVYRPLEERKHAPATRRAMVDRTLERQRLRACTEQLLQRGEGARVVVVGDAGLGKSTLIEELHQNAKAAGIRVLQGASGAVESSSAYFAWKALLRDLMGVTSAEANAALSDDAAAQVNAYLQALPQWLRFSALLGEPLGLALPESPFTAELPGDVRAENTRRMLTAVLKHEAERGATLLLLEDAHWLDSSSWALLRDVAAQVPALMMVLTSRPLTGVDATELARFERTPGCHVLPLDTLPPEHMAELIAQRLGVAEVPAAVLKLLQERAAGHPFFCEELIQSLLDSGALAVKDGQCEVGDLGSLALPSSVEGVILSRIDRLNPGQHTCLKVASVIGLTFSLRAVNDTLPQQREIDAVQGDLHGLSEVNLTLPAEQGAQTWQFKHAITRDVAYDLMPLAQRQPIHHAVAQWLEARHHQDLPAQSAVLAHHWARANAPEKALDYAELAGQQALRNGAFHEALNFFEQARTLVAEHRLPADNARLAGWEKGLATAHYFLGDLQNARQHGEAAVALLDRPVPQHGLGQTLGALRQAARQAAHRRWPQRFVARASKGQPTLDEAADVYRMLSQIYYMAGVAPSALVYVTLRGVNVGEQAGPSTALARNLSNMGTLCGFMGKPAWARWYGTQALAMAGPSGLASTYVWSNTALSEAQAGHWKPALAANSEALERVQRFGDYNFEGEVLAIRSALFTCSGDFANAPSAYERQRLLAVSKGNSQLQCWALLDEVETRLARMEDDAAAHALEQALAVATAPTDGSSTLDKLQGTAQVRSRQGRVEEAAQAAQQVLDVITRQAPAGYYWVAFGANATEVFIELMAAHPQHPARPQWLAQAQRGCKALAKLGATFANVRARAALLKGRLAALQGDNASATAAFEQARQMAEELDMPSELARAALEAARLDASLRQGPALQAAISVFDQLGDLRLRERARQCAASA